jgi:hypothetical protein
MAKGWLGRYYMPKAVELLREGRNEELWQMCCGFLSLNLDEFMDIQKRLLLEQLELLNGCPLGEKIMRGVKPKTVDEFRQQVPLTTYADYCPELTEKREDVLPVKPEDWVHTSGRSGEYPCKWVPLTSAYIYEMSTVGYGVFILSTCKGWGDVSQMKECMKMVFGVAPRPYFSGALAYAFNKQTPVDFFPSLEEAEKLSFEERIKLGFRQALNRGFDNFLGLSLVLVKVATMFNQVSDKAAILPLLSQPKALFRLAKGMVKSKLARRPMLPKDVWAIRGLVCGGLDSAVYKDKIKELWGRRPLDAYGGTEFGLIATQTWDYDGMTFVPNLNFLEFIPEDEHFKWQLDHSYQPKTVLLDEVEAGKNYELVVTNFHGGAMVRYRPGDMVRITSLRNEKLGIDIPQMVFERRADELIDFVFIRLTEKAIWEAIESTGIAYEDWIAYKKEGEPVLQLLIELKDDYQASEADISNAIYQQITKSDDDTRSLIPDDFAVMIDFKVETTLLPRGSFDSYTAQRRAEGVDLAHLKPPHVNPSGEVLTLLVTKPEKVRAGAETESESEEVAA